MSGDQQVEQYVLAYGLFPNAEEAKRQFSQLNLVLPKSIHPTIQQLSAYKSYVNDLGSDELKSASNQLFEVRLKPAALPKIDETLLMSGQQAKGSSNTATTQSMNTSTTVTTTVTQRDAQGNVVNVRQSQSNQQNNSSTPEKIRENSDSSRREVTDPFN